VRDTQHQVWNVGNLVIVSQTSGSAPRIFHYGQNPFEGDVEGMSYEELLQRFGPGIENKGASPSTIESLPVHRHTENPESKSISEEKRACSICLESFEKDEMLKTLTCFHSFHQKCIDNWLIRVANCPVCKTAVN